MSAGRERYLVPGGDQRGAGIRREEARWSRDMLVQNDEIPIRFSHRKPGTFFSGISLSAGGDADCFEPRLDVSYTHERFQRLCLTFPAWIEPQNVLLKQSDGADPVAYDPLVLADVVSHDFETKGGEQTWNSTRFPDTSG